MADVVTKRLHVGGLTPSITPDHLRDRFKSFGTVKDVETLGPDALGNPRPFAYLTIDITPAQLRKCLNIMSGSMWRGTQIRLAAAKPRYDAKLVADHNPPLEGPQGEARRATKRLKRAIAKEGGNKHAEDMRPVTADTLKRRTFWIEKDGHLVRPLCMRAAHPIPAPPGSTLNADARPPARSFRKVINPTKYDATHLAGEELAGGVLPAVEAEKWEFEGVAEDEEMDEDDEGRVKIGAWTNGEDEQEVRVHRSKPVEFEEEEEDTFSVAESDLFPVRGGERADSPLFPTRQREERSSSPLFPVRAARADSPLFPARTANASSPLFPSRVADLRDDLDNDSEMDRSSRAVTPSLSPERVAEAAALPIVIPPAEDVAEESAEGSVVDDTSEEIVEEASEEQVQGADESPADSDAEPTVAAAAPVAVPDPIRAQAAAERSAGMSVLASLMGSFDAPRNALSDDEEPELEVARARGAPSPSSVPDYATLTSPWAAAEGIEEVEVEGVEMPVLSSPTPPARKVLRLRGGAPQESDESDDSDDDSDSGSSSDSSDTDSSDSDSDDSDSSDSSDSSASSTKSAAPAPTAPATGKLKDLFAPTAPKSSFSLLGTLAPGMELDDTVALSTMPHTAGGTELEFLSSAPKSTFDTDTAIPLFFPVTGRTAAPAKGVARSVLDPEPADDAPEEGYDEAYDEPYEEPYDAEEGYTNPNSYGGGYGAPAPAATGYGAQRQWGEAQDAPALAAAKEKKRGFYARSSDAEMRKRWEARRLELTQGWKRRHREAVKHRRRRGGAEEQ